VVPVSQIESPARPSPPVRARAGRLLDARLLLLLGLVAVGSRGLLAELLDGPAVATWSTIFVSITVQALPFLVLGVLLSGALAALVRPGWLASALPRRDLLAVPAASLAGAALPGCECASVPIAARLRAGGVRSAAAMAFMLAAPAINPVVLVSTAVAFPGRPEMVAARFLASLATSVVVGLVWSRVGREAWIDRVRPHPAEGGRWAAFAATCWTPWPATTCWPSSASACWPSPWPSARRPTRSSRPACASSPSTPGWCSWSSARPST
jgi:uncharacterized membrane protein YraQ (UPF0718 family)